MALSINTRYRFVSSKDMNKIVNYFATLTYRVEMQGLTYGNKKFVQAFILPDVENLKEAYYGDLD